MSRVVFGLWDMEQVSLNVQCIAGRTPMGLRVKSVQLTSGEIRFVDEGIGPTVCLLHGAPMTSLAFVRLIRELRKSYRVIAPDLPGFGASIATPSFGATLDAYSDFVADFCRVLQLHRFYVYVNDSSACIAFPALAKLGDNLAGIVIADTVPLPMTRQFVCVKWALRYIVSSAPVRWLNRRVNLFPWLVVSVAPLLNPFPRAERTELMAQFDTEAKRDRLLEIFHQMGSDDQFIRKSAAAMRELASRPVLLLFGQFDPMRILGGVKRFKRVFPKHSVRIIPFEEHFPILASGDRVARVLDDWIKVVEGQNA